MDRRELVHIIDGTVNYFSHCGNQYGSSTKKPESRATIQLIYNTSGYHTYILYKSTYHRETYNLSTFTMVLFTKAVMKPTQESTDEWMKKCGIFTE